jgi:hypothetical protein
VRPATHPARRVWHAVRIGVGVGVVDIGGGRRSIDAAAYAAELDELTH